MSKISNYYNPLEKKQKKTSKTKDIYKNAQTYLNFIHRKNKLNKVTAYLKNDINNHQTRLNNI